ncbi:MAG: F0F1 ATP synthase subunit delta [Gammaproteobacteria bacterium CG22_combo_CG10-13_8_21_14_all_40_8]|nr:MAG: F0F1 ATP synthase subunit delta [Gammaproteobacteria bacterium CG22_combo_CG10-13_8_21_14_all_40_8]
MAELNTLARPYAKAAFEFALESGNLDVWSQALSLAAFIADDSQVKDLLSNPSVNAEQLVKLFVAIMNDNLKGEVTDEKIVNFLKTLSTNNRLSTLTAIAKQFETFKANHEKTVNVELTSAVALTSEQQTLFISKLESKLGRKVTIINHIDASVIGGLLVKAEDLVIDGTVRGKIAKLTETLLF